MTTLTLWFLISCHAHRTGAAICQSVDSYETLQQCARTANRENAQRHFTAPKYHCEKREV